jgi:DNA-binding transcriptional MerR regulator
MIDNFHDEPRYTRIVTAQLAEISIDFLERCEKEQLVQARVIRGGTPGYSVYDIRRITRIARLHEDLGLELESLEVVLNMREQILELREQLEAMELEMARREEQLLHELAALRRQIASESKWR